MERGSDKVSSRMDEELEKQTQALERGSPASSRAEEHRDPEAAEDDEPTPDVHLSTSDTEQRTELARHLQPSRFPATRERLLASAREEHAPERVITLLQQLPGEREFTNVQEVWQELGGGS